MGGGRPINIRRCAADLFNGSNIAHRGGGPAAAGRGQYHHAVVGQRGGRGWTMEDIPEEKSGGKTAPANTPLESQFPTGRARGIDTRVRENSVGELPCQREPARELQ